MFIIIRALYTYTRIIYIPIYTCVDLHHMYLYSLTHIHHTSKSHHSLILLLFSSFIHTYIIGIRRRCEQCDVDYCENCIMTFGAQRLHPSQHYLKPVPVSGSAPVQQITAQERLDRQNALRMHLQLLVHAAYCDDGQCKAKNCPRMKVCQSESE